MVDASAACRMNPLAALGIDRSSLMRDNLRVHGGMVYPGIRTLSSSEKAREGMSSLPLGYDLLYKPDGLTLDGRKPGNGYVGLQRPGGGGDGLGMDRRTGPGDKPSELGSNGSNGFLRLPWAVNPYADPGLYPFLDSSKYAALNMYKASFLSQPSPYLPQHLAYQSLCGGAGGSTTGAERLFYMPPYPPAPISSPLAPPMRIPSATVAPTALSPMQGLGPRIHHEASAYGSQLHQQHQAHQQSQPQPHHQSHISDRQSQSQPQSQPHLQSHDRQPQSQPHLQSHDRLPQAQPHIQSHDRQPQSQTHLQSHDRQPQSHHQSHSDRQHSNSKPSRTSTSKSLGSSSVASSGSSSTSSGTGVSSSLTVHSTPALMMQSPRTAPRPPQAVVPPPPPLIDNSTLDFQKSLFRSPPCSSSTSSSSPSVSHPFYMSSMASEHRSPVRSGGHGHKAKPKEQGGGSEHRNVERNGERKQSKSPSKTLSSERPIALQAPAKDPADKPLDLSAKILELEGSPNGFPQKLEALAKLGYSPTARYGLPPSRELLKETLSPSGAPSKTPERPEIISTLHSSWVVPSPAPAHDSSDSNHNKGPSIIKNKNLDNVMSPQQRSSSCPRIGEVSGVVVPSPAPAVAAPSGGRPSSASPSPLINGEWPRSSPNHSEKAPSSNRSSHAPSGKPGKTVKKPEVQEMPFKPQQAPHLENGHLYLPQNDGYLPPSLAYANRFLPYSVQESMSLPHMPMPGKGPVYPHPVLLGSSSLYPPRLPPKHSLPYGLPPSHGDYLTYHDSQEMVHPLMSSPHPGLDPKASERLQELRSRPHQEKSWQHHEDSGSAYKGQVPDTEHTRRGDRDTDRSAGSKTLNQKPPAVARDEIVCIDLIQDDGDSDSPLTRAASPCTKRGEHSKPLVSGSNDGREAELQHMLRTGQAVELRPGEAHRQAELQQRGQLAVGFHQSSLCPEPRSPCPSLSNEEDSPSPAESSPLPDLPEEQTLRCARTSGDRTSWESTCRHRPSEERGSRDRPSEERGSRDRAFEDRSSLDRTSWERSSSREDTTFKDRSSWDHICAERTFRDLSCEDRNSSDHPPRERTSNESEFRTDRTMELYSDPDKDIHTDTESHEGEEYDDHGCPKARRSSLAKRIANSSGYVGDRFKCVTTELNADSSKLSREQRALQMEGLTQEDSKLTQPAAYRERAMLRFSELELKEKEGGGVAVDQDLADGQRSEAEGDGARGAEDWARCQGPSRTGPEAVAPADEAERDGVPLACSNNRVPVLQRCPHTEALPPREPARPAPDERRRGAAVAEEEERACMPPRGRPPSLPAGPVEGLYPKDAGRSTLPAAPASVPTAAPARKRTYALEPCQPHLGGGQPKEGAENEAREERETERMAIPVKRARLTTEPTEPVPEEVKNLKVCIELTGLRLSKPRLSQELSQWHAATQRSTEMNGSVAMTQMALPNGCPEVCSADRKARVTSQEDRSLKRRSEINGHAWCLETFSHGDNDRVVLPSVPLTPAQRDRLSRTPCTAPVRRPPLRTTTPSLTPFHSLAPGPLSPTPPRLSDKRQKLKEHRRASAPGGPPSPEPGPHPERDPNSAGDLAAPRLRRHGDQDKPKGKRQCKTKHTSQQDGPGLRDDELSHDRESQVTEKHGGDKRKRSSSLSDYSPSSPLAASPPPAPAPSPASRPMPPEARRLIVNKNAGETLLQRAARLGYEEVVLYCLENKVCDVNHRDNAGYCALHEACARGWLAIAQHLVEHGADINCSAQDGTRPLHDAVENDHLEVVRLLLSYGADPTLATYSGRSLLRMTHSHAMDGFLSEYFADLKGRADDDEGIYWEFYGSAVCESGEDPAAYDILANPPGPGQEEDEEHREVFEFEFSDRPLLPCYNIQVSLSQGPRNWLLLSDVLKRLRMSSRAFRAAFAHLEVATIAEAEFYKQASLSQLFSCPDELAAFLPDSKELLDLVETSSELAALLGSSLECLDSRWEPKVARAKAKARL
ncbi:BCL-6 corepressor isoform X2 [Esox lucius]|uniref:BCL-6 corepressor isoform X2 n=1 Tax=Esox lucius TaxID=8010 RepID=UPI001476A7C9|nr:BCL-6 corepressor isoform X2 [Esox lucius]